MRLCVIGTGHVGLVTAACLAEVGNQVIGVDQDPEKVKGLREGRLSIYEPGLEELVRRHLDSGRLSFTTSVPQGVGVSDVIFITVPTPSSQDGSVDVSSVEAVCRDIAPALSSYKVVVEKSTVPVKTGEWVKRTLRLYNHQGADFDVASVPEFLREGCAIPDFMSPDRIVIGVESPRAEKVLRELFQPFGAPLLVVDIKSAELIKHASNSFLALKVSYINAIAQVCELVGADVAKVAEGMGYDRRINREFLNAGIGYGGSCFPKDVAAFIRLAHEEGYDFELLRVVQSINQEQRMRLVKRLREALWVLRDKTVAILGLSFKPNTDDIREAPSLDVLGRLLKEGARVRAYDPVAMDNVRRLFPEVDYCRDAYEAARGAHALAILTEWDEFRSLDLTRLRESMALSIVVDGRNIFEPRVMKELGFEYRGMGR